MAFNWFITHTNTTRFKLDVIVSIITHIWALSTICRKAIDFVPSIIDNYDVLKLKSFFKHNDLASECNFHNFFNLQQNMLVQM
jgi:hypothetical protein